MFKLPLSVYIHYPWCEKKCPYCDFNSHTFRINENYINALNKDLLHSAQYVDNRLIQSIFIGGGTPSLMSIKDLDLLFNTIHKNYKLTDNAEITIEVNPSSASLEKFNFYQDIGINRVSIGVQSFVNKYLKFLGRVHNNNQAISALSMATEVFDNVNCDIIFGLQNQSLAEVENDLLTALKFNISHLSFYQLTIEPNTYFAKYTPILPDDDKLFEMMDLGVEILQQNNLNRYEVSAYGRESLHNMNYWQFGDYIGIGAGAHGKITKGDRIFRTLKNKNPKDYINRPYDKIKDIKNLAFDFMLNALRLNNGFSLSLFTDTTKLGIKNIEQQLDKATNLGLIEINSNYLKPTNLGFNHLNSLQELFL